MFKIRYAIIAMSLLLCSVTSAKADISIGIGLPNVSIGINLPIFPQLVRVPGYPVYYAPRMDANYFFYDGMYWVFEGDNWYASSWYNGPWGIVGPEVVPLYVLRIPVRYYRQPPVYFRGWQANAPPRWGHHWGPSWERNRQGWNNWNRSSSPRPAPLPVYQRQYTGDRYPRVEQQHVVHNQQYRYQPRDKAVRQHYQQQIKQKAPVADQNRKHEAAPGTSPKQPDAVRPAPRQQGAPPGPNTHPPQRGGEQVHKAAPPQPAQQQRGPAAHEQKRPEPVRQEQRQQPGPARVEHKQQPAPAVKEQRSQPAPAVKEQRSQPAPAVKEQHQQQAPKQQRQEKKDNDRGDAQEQGRGHGQGQRGDDDRGRNR